jgi:hypothetical protein
MSEHPENTRPRVTALQWLIVGALAMIFVVVLVVELGPAGDTPPMVKSTEAPPAAPRRPPAGSRTVAAPGNNGATKPPTLAAAWPTFSLATVQEFDPFAKPPSAAADRGAPQSSGHVGSAAPKTPADAENKRIERDRVLAEVQKEVVRIIVGTDRGFVAIVGTKTIHVGDQLHGFLVKEIKANGVVLEEKHD